MTSPGISYGYVFGIYISLHSSTYKLSQIYYCNNLLLLFPPAEQTPHSCRKYTCTIFVPTSIHRFNKTTIKTTSLSSNPLAYQLNIILNIKLINYIQIHPSQLTCLVFTLSLKPTTNNPTIFTFILVYEDNALEK